jgi:hypothetical protein
MRCVHQTTKNPHRALSPKPSSGSSRLPHHRPPPPSATTSIPSQLILAFRTSTRPPASIWGGTDAHDIGCYGGSVLVRGTSVRSWGGIQSVRVCGCGCGRRGLLPVRVCWSAGGEGVFRAGRSPQVLLLNLLNCRCFLSASSSLHCLICFS